MKKTLILVHDKKKYFWPNAVDTKNIDIREVYKVEFSISILSKVRKRMNDPYIHIGVLGDWKKCLHMYEKIIFLDSSYTRQVDLLLRKFSGKIFFLYWNKMNLNYNLAEMQKGKVYKKIQIYTYSRNDSMLHRIPYNSTMYEPKMYIESTSIKYDIVFGGCVFNERINKLDKLLDIFNEQNLHYYMDVSIDSKYSKTQQQPRNYVIKDNVFQYDKYLELVNSSKAVLNIDKYEGMGCSLRALEALYYGKKYITDNIDVKNELFYNKSNVFILGVDPIEDLSKFINSEYVSYPKSVLDYYRLEEWVKRFK